MTRSLIREQRRTETSCLSPTAAGTFTVSSRSRAATRSQAHAKRFLRALQASAILTDFNQFFRKDPQPVIRATLADLCPCDAPNRFLAWVEFAAPGK